MCPHFKRVNRPSLPIRLSELARVLRVLGGAAPVFISLAGLVAILPHRIALAGGLRVIAAGADTHTSPGGGPPPGNARNSLGDGFPDSARLDTVQDRANFVHWFTFLAETQYYAPTARSRAEILDCAALIRFAYRNSLVAHSPAWRKEAGLPFDPGFGDVAKYHYPFGPQGWGLFRAAYSCGPEPQSLADFPCPPSVRRSVPPAGQNSAHDGFVEFADSATILRYNTYRVSRDVRAAQPGDLLFFHQPVQREPFHTMMFVGKSFYQPRGTDWIVYHTGDMNGRQGEIREVQVGILLAHPDLRWRPLASNPNFLGVFRLRILQ